MDTQQATSPVLQTLSKMRNLYVTWGIAHLFNFGFVVLLFLTYGPHRPRLATSAIVPPFLWTVGPIIVPLLLLWLIGWSWNQILSGSLERDQEQRLARQGIAITYPDPSARIFARLITALMFGACLALVNTMIGMLPCFLDRRFWEILPFVAGTELLLFLLLGKLRTSGKLLETTQ